MNGVSGKTLMTSAVDQVSSKLLFYDGRPYECGGKFGGEDEITVRSLISLSQQPKQRTITRQICQTFGLGIVFGRGGCPN